VRVQLKAVLILALMSGLARAEEPHPGQVALASKLALYQDDDSTTVLTSTVDVSSDVSRKIGVQAYGTLDSISSASVDVVSAASPSFHENRYEAGLRLTARLPVEVSAAYTESIEPDWHARSADLHLARDLADQNTRLELALAYGGNWISRVGGPTIHQFLARYQGVATITQLWNERTLLGASYTLEYDDGCQASQYRTVTTTDRGFTTIETHPHQRTRHALGVRALRHVLEASALEASYRIYLDDWGVASHTGELAFATTLGASDLRLRGRAYYQGQADFYREHYEIPATYMSGSRDLSRFVDLSAGAKAAHSFGRFSADLEADLLYDRFADFAPLRSRTAIVVAAGLAATL
jgi:hypothetical protein